MSERHSEGHTNEQIFLEKTPSVFRDANVILHLSTLTAYETCCRHNTQFMSWLLNTQNKCGKWLDPWSTPSGVSFFVIFVSRSLRNKW